MREVLLVLHFIGLAMGLGSGLAFIFLGFAAAKMEKDKARELFQNAFIVTRMGHIGLGLLIFTGLGLMTPYWAALTSMPLLMTKLSLVVVLGALIGISSSMAKKARQDETGAQLKKMRMLGRISLLVTLTIVILAVAVFR